MLLAIFLFFWDFNALDFPSFLFLKCSLMIFFIHRISTQGKLHPCQTDSLSKEMLETDKCYVVDCDSEIFVWMGKHCSVTERKTSISAAEVRIFPPSILFLSPLSYSLKRSKPLEGRQLKFSGVNSKGMF